MRDDRLLKKALGTLPIIHQQHWLKAFVGYERLKLAYPDLSHEQWIEIWKRTQWDQQPRVDGLISQLVHQDPLSDEARIMRQLERGLFPSVYAGGVQWIQKIGFENVLLKFRTEISKSPGYLGHALSVLLGFREIFPFVTEPRLQTMLYERFLEFASSSLFSKINIEIKNTPQKVSFEQVFESCLTHPSFFGHHLICLAYLERNKTWLGDHYEIACSNLLRLSQHNFPDPEDNIEIDFTESGASGFDFKSEIEKLLLEGPLDVHCVTLADSLHFLFQFTKDNRLAKVAQVFRTI